MHTFIKDKTLIELSSAKKFLNKALFLFENRNDCIGVVKNSRKAQKALGKARKIMLEAHLEYCIQEKFKTLSDDREFNKIVRLLKN